MSVGLDGVSCSACAKRSVCVLCSIEAVISFLSPRERLAVVSQDPAFDGHGHVECLCAEHPWTCRRTS